MCLGFSSRCHPLDRRGGKQRAAHLQLLLALLDVLDAAVDARAAAAVAVVIAAAELVVRPRPAFLEPVVRAVAVERRVALVVVRVIVLTVVAAAAARRRRAAVARRRVRLVDDDRVVAAAAAARGLKLRGERQCGGYAVAVRTSFPCLLFIEKLPSAILLSSTCTVRRFSFLPI